MWREAGRVVETSRLYYKKVRHAGVSRINRRTAGWTKGAGRDVAAIRGFFPMRRFAPELDCGTGKPDMGTVARAALVLAVAALTISGHQGFRLDLVPNRAAIASAGIF